MSGSPASLWARESARYSIMLPVPAKALRTRKGVQRLRLRRGPTRGSPSGGERFSDGATHRHRGHSTVRPFTLSLLAKRQNLRLALLEDISKQRGTPEAGVRP